MKKEIREKSPIPVYAVAAVFVVWGLFLPLYRPLHFLLLALIAAGAYLVAGKIWPGTVRIVELPPEPVETGDEKLDALLREGEAAVAELHRLRDAIPDTDVKAKILQIADTTDMIFKDVLEDPSDYKQVRRFADFYLPTAMKLLNTYDRFGRAGGEGEHISVTLARIEAVLDTILDSYKRQFDALFKNQALDIETDIIVLQGMMKKEGLDLGGTK